MSFTDHPVRSSSSPATGQITAAMAAIKATDLSTNLEPINVGLRSIKLIRSNVKDLFKLLADGNQSVYEPSKPDEESHSGDFVNDLQGLVNNINQRLRELETSALLTSSNIASSTNFGNAAYLGLDPSQDKQQLYSSMVQSYRWCDKLNDTATQAYSILSQNYQKRTIWGVLNPQRARLQQRKMLNAGYNYSAHHVETAINTFNKSLGLKIEFDHSFGEPSVLKVTLDRVLKAAVLLRGFVIEWVNVKGINEEFLDLEDRVDIWSESKCEVFRKVTEHMNSAMLFFNALNASSEIALRTFLVWFKSYSTLFDKECKKCGTKLRNYLPPTWRELRTYEAYHDVCRPLKMI